MKKGKWFLIAAVLFVALFFAQRLTVAGLVSHAVEAVTGARVSLGSLSFSLTRSRAALAGFKVWNPPGFSDQTMVEMPQVVVVYDLKDFLRGKTHLRDLQLNLKELLVERNGKGELNLDALKFVKEKREEKAAGRPAPSGEAMPLLIDHLRLQIGRVVYKDYSRGSSPFVREFDIHLDEEYSHVTDLRVLASLVLVRATVNTAIADLTNLPTDLLKGDVEGVLKRAAGFGLDTSKDVAEKAIKTLRNLIP